MVFDDPNVGLVKEPYVGGADTMIDRAMAHVPNVDRIFLYRHAPDMTISVGCF